MSVVAVVDDEKGIHLVLPWASTFARACSTKLTVVCWTHSPTTSIDGTEPVSHDLVQAARDFFDQPEPTELPEILGVCGPSSSAAVINVALQKGAELLVAAASDPSGASGASYSTNPLLRQSPTNVVVLFGDSTRSSEARRIYVSASDNTNDRAAVFLASRLATQSETRVTLVRREQESEQQGLEVGRRELRTLMRESGVENDGRFECQVFQTGDFNAITARMDECDLVLLGANDQYVPTILEMTKKPTVAVIQREPPIRPWHATRRSSKWNPRLSPADYAELIQGLRHGSRLGADFITMLGLAAVVASIGLLQDSPAVVIGSMLLAPLMTPMIGCGLALAQANETLGRRALVTVAGGLLVTLAISFVIGLVSPGVELTPQIYARGEPTVLDLFVAVASAAAAAYALARPSLVGSIAGVAIATALVPPLCSVGLSLAYSDTTNARGAALLFGTNFLAIVLGAAITFRVIGITAKAAAAGQKFWVYRVVGILGVAVILVCVPLQHRWLRSLVETKPQPRAFPLTKTVVDALEERLESQPDVHLITAGKPSSHLASEDVILIIGSASQLDRSIADELIEIVRTRMQDGSLSVHVHCVQEQWLETSHQSASGKER